MSEFLELLPPHEARETLLARLDPLDRQEQLPTSKALGRVLCRPITAPHPLPPFARSTVDGFAVRAQDTFGASDSLPAYLQDVGEVPMGAAASLTVRPGECALIHTGGMLPEGADAVVMVEHTQSSRPEEREILRAVGVGENVLLAGEDVAAGDLVMPAGIRLRPAEIGGLMALGITMVPVSQPPRVAILSSGDEVIPPEDEPGPGEVRDVNTYTLEALIQEAGGLPVTYGIIPDRQEDLQATAAKALVDCDAVVLTAGSSVSTRDLTARVIAALGAPGVLVHGVNVRPGKPTILAVCDSKPVIGLPGNPVSALVIADLFVTPVIETLLGLKVRRPPATVPARLALNLSSQTGREDWIPVRLVPTEEGFQAEPVFGKSNLIFTLVRADGLVRIPPDATGMAVGEPVLVTLM